MKDLKKIGNLLNLMESGGEEEGLYMAKVVGNMKFHISFRIGTKCEIRIY